MCSGKSILVVFSICFASLSFAQSTVAVPSTAQNCTSDGHDANWRTVSSTIPEESGTGQAFCVTNPPGPWFIPGAGANWIAPGPDQANVSAGRKEGHEGEEAAGAHTLVDDREFVGKHAVRPRSPPPCLAKRDRESYGNQQRSGFRDAKCIDPLTSVRSRIGSVVITCHDDRRGVLCC